MATNYFSQLGFDQAMNRPFDVAQSVSGLRTQSLNRDLAQQQADMQKQNMQAQQSAFADQKAKERTAQASGLIYSALSSGQPERAAQLAAQFEGEFKALDPTFSASAFAQMAATPEGLEQLQQETLTLSQIIAGPEQTARFTAQQAAPSKQADPAKVAEFRKWLELNPNATQEEKRQIFSQMVVPQERAFATGTGAGQAKIATEQQLIPIEGEKAGVVEQSKVSAKTTEERDQAYLQAGVDAASALPNLMRSLDLLDQVKTGGFNKVATSARRLFGVEGADEAELSANLGRAVLAQLKPIFGAAFTAAEGDRLVAIEAGFGKSTEGNKRLLRELIDTNLRAANRALSIAKNKGDTTSADILQNTIDQIKAFKSGDRDMLKSDWFLGDDDAPAPAPAPAQGTVGGYKIIEVR